MPRTLAQRSDGAASRLEAASALGLVKTGVTTVATKLSPGTAIDSCSGFDAFDPNAPLLSPVNGFTETESQVPLVLDLGPASLLSERLAGSKTRSITENFLSAATTVVWADLRHFWLWGPVALTVTVMVLAVILAIANPPTANPRWSALQRPALPARIQKPIRSRLTLPLQAQLVGTYSGSRTSYRRSNGRPDRDRL